jgi:Laminin G domain
MMPSAVLNVCLTVLFVTPLSTLAGVYLQGTLSSYVRYPRWRSCPNASLSFEFRALNSAGLLIYADDGGRSSFVMISYNSTGVTARLNVAESRNDRSIVVFVNVQVFDGVWHSLELRRDRTETVLTVDRMSSRRHSLVLSGSAPSAQFGDSPSDSDVFFGGLPAAYSLHDRMHELTLPSVVYEPRFKGYMRNLLHGNCTCLRHRVGAPIDGSGFVSLPRDAVCDGRHNCSRGCLCISNDHGYSCDCSGQRCLAGEYGN